MNHVLSPGLEIHLAGEVFTALAERALYWRKHAILMIADLHLGKSDIFRAAGIAVPYALQIQDIARLDALITHLQPTTLVILGDMVHGKWISDETLAAWQALRSRHETTRFILTRGNHDRHAAAITALVDEVVPQMTVDGVLLSHDSVRNSDDRLSISGHLHPVFRARSWNRAWPAMVLDGADLRLAAFSEFTAGMQIHGQDSRIWVFVDQKEIVQVQ